MVQARRKTIIIARFMPFIRTFAPFVAGVGAMSYPKFILYNIVGGLLWVFTFLLGGYFFRKYSGGQKEFYHRYCCDHHHFGDAGCYRVCPPENDHASKHRIDNESLYENETYIIFHIGVIASPFTARRGKAHFYGRPRHYSGKGRRR